jgi:hypothetical protein
MTKLLKAGLWLGVGLGLMATTVVGLLVVSPRLATRLREWGQSGATMFAQLDARGMQELIEEETRDLSRQIRDCERMLQLIGERNPSLSRDLRRNLAELVAEREELLTGRRTELTATYQSLLTELQRSKRLERERSQRALTDLFVQEVSLHAAVADNQSRIADHTVQRVLRGFLDAVSSLDLEAAKELLSAEARPELTPQRLRRLRETLPSELSSVTVKSLSPEFALVQLPGRDGERPTTITLRSQGGVTTVDDVSL